MGDFYYDEKKFGKTKENNKSNNNFVSSRDKLGNKNNASKVISISLGKSDHISLGSKKKKEE